MAKAEALRDMGMGLWTKMGLGPLWRARGAARTGRERREPFTGTLCRQAGGPEDRRERQRAQQDILGLSWIELNYGTEGRWGENKGGERQMAEMTAQRRGRLRNQEQAAESKHISIPAAHSPDAC